MEILIKTGQLLLSLSILVIFHEAGHFFFAKLFKTRVEKFYLFFDPWFSLFKFRHGETEYGVGWVPLGGYVKISGMIDESMDKEQLKEPPKPYEFRAKPSWQRLLIMLGGVLVNFILAFVIYAMVLFVWGEQYLPTKNLKYGIIASDVAQEAGLQTGDKILSIGGEYIENFSAILPHLLLNDAQYIEIERNGRNEKLAVDNSTIANIIKNESYFIEPAFPFVIEDYTEGLGAESAGLRIGDRIVGINGEPLPYFGQYPEKLIQNAGKTVTLTIERNRDQIELEVPVSETGMLGVQVKTAGSFFELQTHEYGFFESIPAGISKGYKKVGEYLKQFKLLFTPETEAYKQVGGFIAIGKIFPDYWDWRAFWSMTALLSIMLGVVNILPIPALDGGHVTFLLYEMIVGKKPSDKFLEYAQITGMVILLSLLVFANGNDIIKLFQ